MGGGLLQLVAYGAQDVYLTGNPQITFFKVVYRRHTNFAIEAIQQTFNGNPTWGQRVTSTIARNGDLIHRCYLVVNPTNITGNVCKYFGLRLLEYVEIEIGGQKIDKHYSHWLYIWNELTLANSKKQGYFEMIGGKGGVLGSNNLYIPLEFWFCRNVGLSLPLIALQYHEVKINFLFEKISNLAAKDSVLSGDFSANLWVDYIYLDTDERRKFAQNSHEYLIEQLQFTGKEAANNKVKLNFNHPCKEILWTVTSQTNNDNWFNYTTKLDAISDTFDGINLTAAVLTEINTALPYSQNFTLSPLNGIVLTSTVNYSDTQIITVPGYTTTSAGDFTVTGGSGVTYVANKDTSNDTLLNITVTGWIEDMNHDIEISAISANFKKITFNGVSITESNNGAFEITGGSGVTYTAVTNVNALLSIKVDGWTDGMTHSITITPTDQSAIVVDSTNYIVEDFLDVETITNSEYDVSSYNKLTGIQFTLGTSETYENIQKANIIITSTNVGNNHTLISDKYTINNITDSGLKYIDIANDLASKGDTSLNPVKEAKLVLNGNDRFAVRSGNYFNMIQPFQHHENIPGNAGINVYSFALKPEEHQPSGTLNMSRIDTASLNLTYNPSTGSALQNVNIYAVNYNVLRILSGMGGIAYSN